VKESICSLTEGRIVIQWPSPLSKESVQDCLDWLKLIERQIAREGNPNPEGPNEP
jgi:hypothetical protein